MKKMLILMVLLLSGCSSLLTNHFVYDDNCPRLCWLGINPGITTVKEAQELVNSSSAIDKNRLQFSDKSILTDWFTGRPRAFPSTVNIEFEGELVKSISFGQLPYKMDEVIDLLGQPDEISIRLVLVPDAEYIEYFVYYHSSKTLVHVLPGTQNGPDPVDTVSGLFLNSEFNQDILPTGSGTIQPWIGYGHLKDYIPEMQTPSTTIP